MNKKKWLLIIRILLFLAAIGLLLNLYLFMPEPAPLKLRILFWLLLISTSLGLYTNHLRK